MKSLLSNLNFFSDPDEQDEWHLHGQRLSTRLFIVSMIIALCILVLYTSTSSVTTTKSIKQPSIDVYLTLQNKYPETLSCPCSSISNEHNRFISFQPTFHPVCYSNFITENWTNFLIATEDASPGVYDFRITNVPFFPTISILCQLSLEIINNALLIFDSTKYITKYVQKSNLFQAQTQQLIDNMKQPTKNSFQLLLSMLRQTAWGNALLSTGSFAFIPDLINNNGNSSRLNTNNLNLLFYPRNFASDSMTVCSCKLRPTTCNQLSYIYSIDSLGHASFTFTVPGYYRGCYATESMFQSNFECFVNETCFQMLNNSIYPTSKYPFNPTLIQLNNSRYNATTSVEYLVENLMIEEWNNQTSFESYFEQCNPSLCTYTYNLRGDITYVFATTIGLIGGLITIFKLIIPFIVTVIRRWRQNRRTNVTLSMIDENIQTITMCQKLKTYILTFNLFKNRNKRSEEQLRHQRISTRLFLIISFITLVILLFYISLDNVTFTIIKKNPTFTDFSKLSQQYPNTVQCPCKTTSIEHKQFITFQPRLHSICSSAFVHQTSEWFAIDYPQTMVDYLYHQTQSTQKDDFRQIAGLFFQLINSLCVLSSQTINTELETFYSNTFITLNLVTFKQFQTQINNQLITQFLQNIARSFVNSLYIAENMTAANMLFSALSTDSIFTLYPDYFYQGSVDNEYLDYPYAYYSNEYGYYYRYEYIYDRKDQIYNLSETGIHCDCQKTSWCIQQSIVYDLDRITKLFSPPGIFVGCYIIPAVLQSDLRCFFDVDCLQQLVNSLYLVNINVSDIVLTNLTESRYQSNSSLLEIITNLMIEEWNNQTSFNDYFNECQPSVCTATYIIRGNIIYIVTTIIGLIGGLTKVYKFSIPILVKIVMRFIIPYLQKSRGIRNNVRTGRNAL